MTRILEDVNSVERMLIDGIEQGVVAALQVVIVLGVMFYVNCHACAAGPGAVAAPRGRRALVHADRSSSLPSATPRFLRHECVAPR